MYRTGDLGRRAGDGAVLFVGRLDDQVKIHGVRVELGEIEYHLRRHPAVMDAAAVLHPTGDGSGALTAYYVADPELSPPAVREHLAQYLPAGMLPQYIVPQEQLPANLHGKVDRKALPLPQELLYASEPAVAPSGETETWLAEVWRDILGLEVVSADRTFLDLGGDSLKAIRTVGQIYEDTGLEIELGVFFEDATVQSVARLIEGAAKGAGHA